MENKDGQLASMTTQPNKNEVVEQPMQEKPKKTSMPTNELIAYKINQLMMFFYFFVAALLIFRFTLSLFAANRSSIFVDFVYQLTTPFMFPFENMFGQVGAGSYVIEFEIGVALIVYALLFFGISRLAKIFLTK